VAVVLSLTAAVGASGTLAALTVPGPLGLAPCAATSTAAGAVTVWVPTVLATVTLSDAALYQVALSDA
jgi:hypothetical protein